MTQSNVSGNADDLSIVSVATGVELDWLISGEAFKGYCVVEKSIDGKKWKDVGIAFSGEWAVNEYKYIDKNITDASMMYYRIRRIDENGNTSLSGVQTWTR